MEMFPCFFQIYKVRNYVYSEINQKQELLLDLFFTGKLTWLADTLKSI